MPFLGGKGGKDDDDSVAGLMRFLILRFQAVCNKLLPEGGLALLLCLFFCLLTAGHILSYTVFETTQFYGRVLCVMSQSISFCRIWDVELCDYRFFLCAFPTDLISHCWSCVCRTLYAHVMFDGSCDVHLVSFFSRLISCRRSCCGR